MCTTKKFIYFAADNDYWKFTNNDLYLNPEVYIYEDIKNPLLRKFHHFHNCWKTNRFFELPLKSIWFRYYADEAYMNPNCKQWAIFAEANILSYNRKYLKYLRKKYPKMVFLYVFSNPCSEYNLRKLERVKELYDHIITFNEADSQKYGFETVDIHGYSKNHVPDNEAIRESDLFFVGADKGRLPLLLKIYDRCKELNLACDFSIVGVEPDRQDKRDGIVYNHYLSYTEVLQHVEKTKCVLEILEGNCNYSSIRTTEALVYDKKLITTSSIVKNASYYSPSQILCIEKVDDISLDFFQMPISKKYRVEDFSPNNGLKQIEALERKA